METLQTVITWLSSNESLFSALAALAVIGGLAYGAVQYLLSKSVNRMARKSSGASASGKSTSGAAAIDAASPIGDTRYSLSVLLFNALSKNEDDEFLASGITSEVIAQVTMVPNIRVSSRLSSYSFRSGEADVREVAQKLNSRYILSGSLLHAGNRIRVIAQLTDVEHDREIWANTYDRELEDLFAVQQDISKCIVGAVLGEVRLAETLFAGTIPDHQLDAWGLAQKAYHFWLTKFTPEAILQACDYLRQALKLDPDYASARAALAMLLAQQMTIRICPDYDACAAEAREQIEIAYEQSPNDIDVLENAGVTWQNLGETRRATRALRRVVQMAPLNLTSRGYLALLLALTGSEEEAQEAVQIIEDNEATAPHHPSMPYWQFFMAVAKERLGEPDEAVRLAEASLTGQPGWVHNYYIIANARAMTGDIDGAKDAMQTATVINPFLTAELYADNVRRIVGDEERAEPFIGGLKQHGLIQEASAQSA